MAARVRSLGARLRPHVKSHKCVEIMRRQLAAGARGITVATVREAELFVAAGAHDVLVAYPPVGARRVEAVRRLSRRARVIVACSERAHVEALAAAGRADGRQYPFYWEVDCGAGRLGSAPGRTTAEALEALGELSGARLAGVMTFPGHAYAAADAAALERVAEAEGDALSSTAAALRERGIDAGTLSGGATPIAWLDAGKVATEYRFGNYVFYDATQVQCGAAALHDCALTVAATVIGRPEADRVILDAGSKAIPPERMHPRAPGFGSVVGHPDLRIVALYEEHAIALADAGRSRLRVGDVVEVVPNHACTCANLHAAYHVTRAEGGITRWDVAARGWEGAATP
jgi:D-serine deaminase-like pyridoxal phosphate-dependent protein